MGPGIQDLKRDRKPRTLGGVKRLDPRLELLSGDLGHECRRLAPLRHSVVRRHTGALLPDRPLRESRLFKASAFVGGMVGPLQEAQETFSGELRRLLLDKKKKGGGGGECCFCRVKSSPY